MVEMLNIDCMDYLKDCPDKAFELAIVDPPYGIGNFLMPDGGGIWKPGDATVRRYNGANCDWNKEIPSQDYFAELLRISEKQIIWGANYYNCFSASGGALVWYKNTGHKSLSQCEIASISWQRKVDYFHFKPLNGFCATEERVHPCQKSVELYRYCLHNYAKPGDKILDTHGGSGSSAIACHQMGFDMVWMEKDADYYAAACKRFKEQTAQEQLFTNKLILDILQTELNLQENK